MVKITTNLTIPCSYQGGKSRLAGGIVDIMLSENEIDDNTKFYDLCCGSGAISIELINRGIKPENITMLDKAPFGLVWKHVGEGTFNINKFNEYIRNIPIDVREINGHAKDLIKQELDVNNTEDIVYKYLILQACAFGSKPVWLKTDSEWASSSFRNYWTPTETSKRKSPVNPMMPMPNTLYTRMENIVENMKGVHGIYGDINSLTDFPENSIVYIDPPYKETTGYGYDFDIIEYAEKIKRPIYVSEAVKLSENAHLMSGSRAKGGISGNRKTKNEEWLSKIS